METSLARRNLIEMLSFTGLLPPWSDPGTRQHLARMDLYETIIGMYAEAVTRALRAGMHRTYVPARENLGLVKGRIVFPEQLKWNLAHPHRTVCAYKQFTADNPLNQALRYTTWLARRATMHRHNQRLLDVASAVLGDVTLAIKSIDDMDRIHLDRFSEPFKPALEWARLLVSNLLPSMRTGARPTFALLFDMSKVFEAYVERVCKKHLRDLYPQIEGQKVIGHLLHMNDNSRKAVQQKPDLVLRPSSGVPVVIDAKYKKYPGSVDQAAPADLRQVFLYQALLRQREQREEPRLAILLYPRLDLGASTKPPSSSAWLVDEEGSAGRIRVVIAAVNVGIDGRSLRTHMADEIRFLVKEHASFES